MFRWLAALIVFALLLFAGAYVLAGPLRFTPEGRTYRFEGELAVGRWLAGKAGLTTSLVAVRGIEPRFDG